MTERQYNSKLLGDKLSQLPVPPNQALWSRIEAQLLMVPPVVQHPPVQAAPKLGKAVLLKTTVALISSVLFVLFMLWLVHRKAAQPKPAPAKYKQAQPARTNSIKADTASVLPTEPLSQKTPLVKPIPQPAPADTVVVDHSPLPHHRTIEVTLRDSTPSLKPPAAAAFRADSIRLPPKKKDEGYYFEVKKKKG